jgi:trehalose 6-phosphate synthase
LERVVTPSTPLSPASLPVAPAAVQGRAKGFIEAAPVVRGEGGIVARKRGLITIANRLPVRQVGKGRAARWQPSEGGLVTALTPIVRESRGAWVGWTGVPGRAPRAFEHDDIRMRPVALTSDEVDGFYHEFSNRTLWPLYHDAIRTPEFNHQAWAPFVSANMKFAKAAASVASKGDLVWVHDYHMHLVPAMLRAMRPDLRIGFFLHIPFPPEELFAWLPWRKALLEGLLGADVVGFQTGAGARNFSRVVREFTEAQGTDTHLRYQGRDIQVNAFPISIDADWFETTSLSESTITRASEIRERVGAGRRILLAVDRLDYTKGIDHRLRAFELLLKRGDASVDDCVLIQVAAPSRERVAEYATMRTRIEQLVGRINGTYSEPGRVAVHYFRRGLSREEVVAFYRAADVMIVTPLRDGMNLVAKEYPASRKNAGGVLILSEFAGAAAELRRAILVNPRDLEGMADAMRDALRMPDDEARHRMGILRVQVKRHDVYDWARSFMEALKG